MTTAKCPICSKPADPSVHPFCSKRCADVDLQRWFAGAYLIRAVEGDDAEGVEATDDEA